jgi:hypothetical protein
MATDPLAQGILDLLAAARHLEAAGEVEILQGGVVVDPDTAKGPIRIRRKTR